VRFSYHVHRIFQQLGRLRHPRWISLRIVDCGVPRLSTQRCEVELLDASVAAKLYDRCGNIGLMLPAIEHGNAMSARNRLAHLIRTDVTGSTEDEDVQRRSCAPERSGESKSALPEQEPGTSDSRRLEERASRCHAFCHAG